jgi:lipocalin
MRAFALSLLLFTASVEAQFVQQGSRLRGGDASGGAVGTNTAVAGGPLDHGQTGAAWIFTRNGKVWSQEGPRLVGSDAAGDAEQGTAVAISADGNTALVGGPRDRFEGTFGGAGWVFTRTAGVWSQQGAKLVGTGAVGAAHQGSSVGLSADGNTAILGGPSDNGSNGAAWIFTRNGGVWTQQGSKLVGLGASGASEQGFSVALSGDGNTAIVGGPSGTDGGAVWIFTRTNGGWTQQGLKVITLDTAPRFGSAVALSSDGDTAIVGGPDDESDRGAAWILMRTAGTWAQQGSKLVGSSENAGGRQGTSVALSADGNTAVSGGYLDDQGAIWVFTRTAGLWSQQGSKLVGTDAQTQFGSPFQGRAVAISGNATTIIEAGSGDANAGSVWPFSKAVPTVATISGNGQSAQINTAFAPLSVIVRDEADQPSSNVSVTFAVTAGPSGAGGTFGSSATVLTASNGIATAPTLTANGMIGGFTVTAATAASPAVATFDLSNAALPAPANVIATAMPQPSVSITWTASSGATLYEVLRSQDGVTYTTHATTDATAFIDQSSVFFNSSYLYKVRAIEPAFSGFSAPDLATVIDFTDPTLAGVTIRAAHFTELRQAVRVVRGMAGLEMPSFTDSSLVGVPVKAIHLAELRAALDEARARLMLPPVIYARPVIIPRSTRIKGTDVLELRSGVQ